MILEPHLETHKVEAYELAADELQDKAKPKSWGPTLREYRRAFNQYLALRRKRGRALGSATPQTLYSCPCSERLGREEQLEQDQEAV